jgi:hypothetical protein
MSDQDNIFNKDETGSQSPDQTAQANTQDGLDQLLQSIQNEQGAPKYKSAEDALTALKASQEHIARLEAENTEFKAKSTENATLQSVLDAVKPQGDGDTAPTLDEAAVASLVESIVTQRDTAKTQTSNTQSVAGKFVELYGDKGEAEFYEQAAAKGLDRTWINQLAATNPDAVFKVLGIEKKTKPNAMSQSFNTSSQEPQPSQPKKFNPFVPSENSALDKWRQTVKATNERLGISE